MDRRELLGALTGIAAGIGAEAKVIDTELKPLLAVLSFDKDMRMPGEDDVKRLEAAWVDLFDGKPPCKLLILPPGMNLDMITDPRFEEKQRADGTHDG